MRDIFKQVRMNDEESDELDYKWKAAGFSGYSAFIRWLIRDYKVKK
jgi:hypothetical protein